VKILAGHCAATQFQAMECSFENLGDVLAAAPAGRLDATSCNEFKAVLHARLDENAARHLVIDLAAIEYISSAGFRELFLAGRRMGQGGGTFSACAPQPAVRELFEIAQFTTVYPLHETREAALAAVDSAK
jgi:stage II sporulation protein AA (anti-sigma F factor antagonist)